MDMDFPSAQRICHDGFHIALYEAGPPNGFPIILIHGWPELAYSWKPLIKPLARAGYRFLAFDMRGFGGSSAPLDPQHYGVAQIVSDIEAILDEKKINKAAVIGHDWGGIIVWHAARMLFHRISHVVSLCTPHIASPPIDPIDIFRSRYGDEHYFVHFNERPGQADRLFSEHADLFFRWIFRKTPPELKPFPEMFHLPARFAAFLETDAKSGLYPSHHVMSHQDMSVYIQAYQKSGFTGGINLYRNTTANWMLAAGLSAQITQPTLMLSAEHDLFLPPALTEPMVNLIPRLERHTVPDCGHWMTWEQPDLIATLILDWLSDQAFGG